jgi:PleD family two-component response regulator
VLRVTISVGYASLDELVEKERGPETLMRLADERLYRAKTGGRNRVCGL